MLGCMGALAGTILVLLVAIEHLWFLVLEMFLFTKPIGLETFRQTQQAAETCAVLAKNQGLYNGFLAAGLITAVVARSALLRRFSLVCVMVAGVYGAITLGATATLILQTGPALLALVVSEVAARRAAA